MIFLLFLMIITLVLLVIENQEASGLQGGKRTYENPTKAVAGKSSIIRGKNLPSWISLQERDAEPIDPVHPSRKKIAHTFGLTNDDINLTLRMDFLIQIAYESYDGQQSCRYVDVTEYYPDYETVTGFCRLRKAVRSFVFARIRWAKDSDGRIISEPLHEYFTNQYILTGNVERDKNQLAVEKKKIEDEGKRRLPWSKLSDFEAETTESIHLKLFLNGSFLAPNGELVPAEIETFYVSMLSKEIYCAVKETDLSCDTHVTRISFSQVVALYDETGESVGDVESFFKHRLLIYPKYVAKRLWQNKRNTIRSILFLRGRGFSKGQRAKIFKLLPSALQDTFLDDSYKAIFHGHADDIPKTLTSFKSCVSKAFSLECKKPEVLRNLLLIIAEEKDSEVTEVQSAQAFIEKEFSQL